MSKKHYNKDLDRGKVQKAYTSILDFSIDEVNMFINKLLVRKEQLRNNKTQEDTIEL